MIRENQNKYDHLRLEYNVFYFERFEYKVDKNELKICYSFNLANKISFSPELIFHIPADRLSELPRSSIENLIFHIGMIELISYWKAACPPTIIVKPFRISNAQIDFWKKLYYNGLGEFFYLNGIQTNIEDFVSIQCESEKTLSRFTVPVSDSKVLIPIGGGKDSVVTLELLKTLYKVTPFIVNPRQASIKSIEIAGFKLQDSISVNRTIDPVLIRLNQEGFLNGHTPFSALLAFVSLACSSFSGNEYIVLSNESSANEPTVLDGPNHQYSKSLEFEQDFRNYIHEYITDSIEYFSFLRPLSEYKIASLFAGFPQHHLSFKSCNVGSKNDAWCGKCPKCLFTAIILSPFIGAQSINEIFNTDIFNDNELLPILEELTGIKENKPFECVGTTREVNLALVATIQKTRDPLPDLLKFYASTSLYNHFLKEDDSSEMSNGKEHFLPDHFLKVLTANE